MQFLQSVQDLLDAVERGEVHRGDVVYVGAHRYARLEFHVRARLWRGLRERGAALVTEPLVGEQIIIRRHRACTRGRGPPQGVQS
jgi:hypothetical protein